MKNQTIVRPDKEGGTSAAGAVRGGEPDCLLLLRGGAKKVGGGGGDLDIDFFGGRAMHVVDRV